MTEKQKGSDQKSTEKPAPAKKDQKKSELSEQELKDVAGGMISRADFPEDDDLLIP